MPVTVSLPSRSLSDRDRDIFLALLEEEVAPNAALHSAFEARERLIVKQAVGQIGAGETDEIATNIVS